MIGEIFKALFITSLAGSALAGVISLFRPITKKLFGYSWHYYIWLSVIFVMLMPVRFAVNPIPAPSVTTQAVQTEQITVSEQSEATGNIAQANTEKPQLLQKAAVIWGRIIYNRMNIFGYLWLIGAVALILLNVARYMMLNIKIRKNGKIISCPEISEYTDRKINVRAWGNIASPFMTGVFRPTLILPETELSDEQLQNILRHEMTHFKRHDILYKWFAEFVKCVHWFNPVAWYVSKQIAAECEISCDMAVTKNMSGSEEMSYINTILSLLPTGKSKQLPLTTQMASSKKILKRRFIMIKNKKTTSRLMSVISAVIAIAMLSTTVFASGILSDLTADDYTVEMPNNGEKIEIADKTVNLQPFSDEEVAAARAVVEEYFKAANEKGKRGELKTLTSWHNASNVVLNSDIDAIVTLNDIQYDANDPEREGYVTNGRGSVYNVTVDDVIVFRVDYDVSVPQGGDAGAYSEGNYSDWKMILIRDGKDGKWFIDDMGY